MIDDEDFGRLIFRICQLFKFTKSTTTNHISSSSLHVTSARTKNIFSLINFLVIKP